MKVGILSRHSVANYGSLWQAYALQTAIEEIGYEAVNINYTPAGETGSKLAKTLSSVSRWKRNPITKMLFLAYQYPSTAHTFNTFKKYRKKYLKETNEYTDSNQLSEKLPSVDLFCTGSDQVWNLLYDNKIDDTYFFDFLPEGKKRIAYAASFGGNKFECENTEKYRLYLKKYAYITVREESGVKILKDFGIDSNQVLDPTLLLSGDEWERLLPKNKSKEDYILIYQLKPNKEFDKYALELSKRTGIKLIRISTMYFQRFKCGEFHYLPQPTEFLWYIKNAKYLLTDSFHGTCFALSFQTPFIEILPDRYNERNKSLLKTIGVENRILDDYNDLSIIERKIDWEIIQNNILNKRMESIKILKTMLKGVQDES